MSTQVQKYQIEFNVTEPSRGILLYLYRRRGAYYIFIIYLNICNKMKIKKKRYLRNRFKLFHIFLLIKNRQSRTLFFFHGSFVKIIGKFIYDTNKKLRDRLTRANERKKVNQCYNQNEDELRPRSLTVECMERPPRRPRPTPRHSKSLKFNREHSQQSEGNYNFTSGMPGEYY